MACDCLPDHHPEWRLCPICGKPYSGQIDDIQSLYELLLSLSETELENLTAFLQNFEKLRINPLQQDTTPTSDLSNLESNIWITSVDESGEYYFYNIITDETTWEPPEETGESDRGILENLTKKSLKNYLHSIEQPVDGSKDELIDRILDILETGDIEPEIIQHIPKSHFDDQETSVPPTPETAKIPTPLPPPKEIIQCRNCDGFVPVMSNEPFVTCLICGTENNPQRVKTRRGKAKPRANPQNPSNWGTWVIGLCVVLVIAILANDGVVDLEITDSTPKDSDGDGLSDTMEWDIGTDSTKRDTDGDGLDDYTEVNMGTNPLSRDSDNDGYSDLQDNWPLQNWVVEVTWSGWETEQNEICEQVGSRSLSWSVRDSSWNTLDSGGSSGSFNIDVPDNSNSADIELNLDAYYWNCQQTPEMQLFYGFSCVDCSDPGPAGSGAASYTFTVTSDSQTQTQQINGARSGQDWRSEGWLSASSVSVSSKFI